MVYSVVFSDLDSRSGCTKNLYLPLVIVTGPKALAYLPRNDRPTYLGSSSPSSPK